VALLELSQIHKRYDLGEQAVHALRGVDLRIEDGEFIAIMGTSGSGKSTLMNILGCLDRPTSGQYLLAGQAVGTMAKADLAVVRNRFIGFVFQSFHLLKRTSALENVELPLMYGGVGLRERHRRARAALERVGLAERMDHLPNQLSGGQQQRVAIARAIVNDPRLLLADEPTGNLDSRTSMEIMALFQELGAAGITVVLVTHEPDVAAYAARVVWVRDGMIVKDYRQVPVDARANLQAEAGQTQAGQAELTPAKTTLGSAPAAGEAP
jgi:putative ABC transport system ATP-binding protein